MNTRMVVAARIVAAILQNQELMRKIMREFEAKTADEMREHIVKQAYAYADEIQAEGVRSG